jgi:hypothetical protein
MTYTKEWYEKNKEAIKKAVKRWKSKNPEKVKKYQKKSMKTWILKNPEQKQKMGERVKLWQQKRKRTLVEIMGGKCEKCGYNKCLAALGFHHKDPTKKESSRDWLRKNFKIDENRLLCANCHMEEHHENPKIRNP